MPAESLTRTKPQITEFKSLLPQTKGKISIQGPHQQQYLSPSKFQVFPGPSHSVITEHCIPVQDTHLLTRRPNRFLTDTHATPEIGRQQATRHCHMCIIESMPQAKRKSLRFSADHLPVGFCIEWLSRSLPSRKFRDLPNPYSLLMPFFYRGGSYWGGNDDFIEVGNKSLRRPTPDKVFPNLMQGY